MNRREAIERLERRLIHLQVRIENAERDGRDLSYDKSELAALRLALRELSHKDAQTT